MQARGCHLGYGSTIQRCYEQFCIGGIVLLIRSVGGQKQRSINNIDMQLTNVR
jgi:hypothetical protein